MAILRHLCGGGDHQPQIELTKPIHRGAIFSVGQCALDEIM